MRGSGRNQCRHSEHGRLRTMLDEHAPPILPSRSPQVLGAPAPMTEESNRGSGGGTPPKSNYLDFVKPAVDLAGPLLTSAPGSFLASVEAIIEDKTRSFASKARS